MSKKAAIIGISGVALMMMMFCSCSSVGSAIFFMMGDEAPSSSASSSSASPDDAQAPSGVANVRYVRLERPSADYPKNIINLAEVEVFDEKGVNVASGKSVTGGPGAAHNAGPYARLVDGNKEPSNFAHTTGNGDAFMQVDLGAATIVKKVVITNRLNCCHERTENMKVTLLDADKKVLKTTDTVNKGQKEMTIDFSASTPAWEYSPM